MGTIKSNSVQHGLQALFDTAVPATYKHFGSGTYKFLDTVDNFGASNNTGAHSTYVELVDVPQTGTQLTLADTPCSAESLVWFFNMALKALPGPASSFAFTLPVPGAAANSVNLFTFEFANDTQEYEFPNGFVSKFAIHADEGNPKVQMNYVIEGGESTPSTATSSLGFLANRETLLLVKSTLKIDALGTAPGTASALTGWLKGFSIDANKTGFMRGFYADGRATRDYGKLDYGGYDITGKLRGLFDSNAVTQIANARAGTGKNIQIKLNGSSSRAVAFNLPIVFTDIPEIGSQQSNNLQMCEFAFRVGDSSTSTAQSPSVSVTLSGSATVT